MGYNDNAYMRYLMSLNNQQNRAERVRDMFRGAVNDCATKPVYPLEDKPKKHDINKLKSINKYTCKNQCGYGNDNLNSIREHEMRCKV